MKLSEVQLRTSATLKRRMRILADGIASATGILAWLETRMRFRLTVLMYHRVLPQEKALASPFPSMVMPDDIFRAQVEWLAKRYHVLPVRAALDCLVEPHRGGRPIVAITFDDGYADNSQIAAPILEEHGVRGSFFVTTRFVEGETLWYDRAAELIERASPEDLRAWSAEQRLDNDRAVMSKTRTRYWIGRLKHQTQELRDTMIESLAVKIGSYTASGEDRAMSVRELQALSLRGHEVGSHTLSHPILPLLADDQLAKELELSRAKVADWTGAAVSGLAYPNGDYDERVVQAARRAGFAYALTTTPGMFQRGADPLRIPRRDITFARVADGKGCLDRRALRSEISAFREFIR